MRIELLNPNYLHQLWPVVEPMLAKAMAHAKGEITLEQLKVYLSNGAYQLILFIDGELIIGAVAYEWTIYPNDRCFYILAIGGKTNDECVNQMFSYAKSQGATTVRGSAHKSVARLWRMKYGFETIYYMVEKRL